MKPILFTASIFYILGLKLTSKIEIKPIFHTKPITTETIIIQEDKNDNPPLDVKPTSTKKNMLDQANTKSDQSTTPAVKNTEK